MTRLQRLEAFLHSMGSTADEVAAFLRKHKIKGQRNSACDCPVASALKRKFRGLNGTASYNTAGDFCGVRCMTTSPVRAFIVRFDTGMYPDLEQ